MNTYLSQNKSILLFAHTQARCRVFGGRSLMSASRIRILCVLAGIRRYQRYGLRSAVSRVLKLSICTRK